VTVLDLLLMQPPETETGSTSGAVEAVTEIPQERYVRKSESCRKFIVLSAEICQRARSPIARAQLQAGCKQAGMQQPHSQENPADGRECNTNTEGGLRSAQHFVDLAVSVVGLKHVRPPRVRTKGLPDLMHSRQPNCVRYWLVLGHVKGGFDFVSFLLSKTPAGILLPTNVVGAVVGAVVGPFVGAVVGAVVGVVVGAFVGVVVGAFVGAVVGAVVGTCSAPWSAPSLAPSSAWWTARSSAPSSAPWSAPSSAPWTAPWSAPWSAPSSAP